MVFTLLFFLLFGLLTVYLTRRSVPALSPGEALLAFGCKGLLACLYGYIFIHYYQGDDTWDIHIGSLNECRLLKSDPVQFFLDFLPLKAWRISGGQWGPAMAYYLDKLEWHLLVKPLAIFNLISDGNYYSNAVFFSFLTFWGHFLLFKLALQHFPAKRLLLLAVVFFFPPVVFWLSGIRADGLLFLSFSFFMLHAYRWIHGGQTKSLWWSLLGLAGILIFRNILLLIILPALVAWFVTVRYDRRPRLVFGAVYGIAVVLFFLSSLLPGWLNLPQMVANKQEQFMKLEGNTRFALSPLTAHAGSYWRVLPEASLNTFARPFVWEARGPLQIMAAIEIWCFWILLILMALGRSRTLPSPVPAWCWFMISFSVVYYLFIGYVVPFPGAIVRYKSIPELLLMTTMVLGGDAGWFKQPWRRLARH